jgi:hypothetical protein
MTLDAQIVWDEDLNQWVNALTGEPIPQQRITDEMFLHTDAAQDAMAAFTLALYAGEIDIEEWETAMALELQDGFIANSALAVGGVENLDAAVLASASALLVDQLGFLGGFANDIVAGNVSQAQALTRANQYGNAIGQSYWEQWQNQQDTNQFGDLHNLTRIPQDGSTECRGNCRCHLEPREDGIYWVLNDGAKHCEDCPEMANGNPWAPML